MLQARDAILAAANAGGGTAADIADIWAGFAARGMGVWATLNPDTFAVVENFSKTGYSVPSFRIDDVSASSRATAGPQARPSPSRWSTGAPRTRASHGRLPMRQRRRPNARDLVERHLTLDEVTGVPGAVAVASAVAHVTLAFEGPPLTSVTVKVAPVVPLLPSTTLTSLIRKLELDHPVY